jgi:2-oxoisovalerate ferredoxin oxidoreductase delta subunit
LKKYKVVTSISYPTEGALVKTVCWRVFKPKLDESKCIKCLRCWIFCPESSIKRKKDGTVSIDYTYCKGCGVCASECKVKAITMEREEEKK